MEEFIRILTQQIRCEKARTGVAREISDHIEDAAEAYERGGMSLDQALEEAVRQMGDPVEIGVELDRIHRPKMDWRTFVMVCVLSIGGLIVQYSAGGLQAKPEAFVNQCFYTIVGFAVMILVCYMDYSFLGSHSRLIYWILSAVIGIYSVKGPYMPAHSFLVFLYVPVYAGILYTYRKEQIQGIIKCMAYMILPLLISVRGSLATGITFFIVFNCMLLYAVWRKWFAIDRRWLLPVLVTITILLPVLGITFFYFFAAASYQKVRLQAWMHPGDYAMEAGYIYYGLKQSLSQGKLLGAMSGENLLPGGSDWLLAQLMLNYGILFGVIAVAALLLFVLRAFKVTFTIPNQLGRMIGMGCGLVFLVESAESVGMNLGLFPSTTTFAPFLTYGAAAMIVYSVLIGLLLSICRYRNVLTDSAVSVKHLWHVEKE